VVFLVLGMIIPSSVPRQGKIEASRSDYSFFWPSAVTCSIKFEATVLYVCGRGEKNECYIGKMYSTRYTSVRSMWEHDAVTAFVPCKQGPTPSGGTVHQCYSIPYVKGGRKVGFRGRLGKNGQID
jgi:hypothetical protein